MSTFPAIALCCLLIVALCSAGASEPTTTSSTTRASGCATFDRADAPYRDADVARDFGNGTVDPKRSFAAVVEGALRIAFNANKKVLDTGFASHVKLPARQQYTLSFRVRFPDDFEPGLHGKQLGFSGGAGYDGGRGEEARTKGDGWSVRLQFDSKPDAVTNTLYVYHARMTNKYGGPVGATPFALRRGEWHAIKLRVTMQSAADRADGRIEAWRDGEKTIDVQDLQFVTQERGRQIDRLRLEVFPGGGGAFPSRDTFVEFDDIAWSDRADD